MENFRTMLQNVTDLELALEVEPDKRINLSSTLVEVVTETKIAVAIPTYNGRRFHIETGKRVRVIFKKEDVGVCNFTGLVVSHKLEGEIPLIYIQMVSNVDKNQRRDYFRLSIVTDVIFKIQTGVTTEKQVNMGKLVEVEIPVYRELQVVTRDISGGGLRAMVGERFEPGMKLTVILLIENERIEVKAEVVRCQIFDETVKRYDCGLRFLEVEEKIRSRIIAFIFEKQRNLRKKGLV